MTSTPNIVTSNMRQSTIYNLDFDYGAAQLTNGAVLLNGFVLGHNFKILNIQLVTQAVGFTTGPITITPSISGVPLTDLAVVMTTVGGGTLGNVIAASPTPAYFIATDNIGGPAATLSLNCAGTSFTGAGIVNVSMTIQNTDSN